MWEQYLCTSQLNSYGKLVTMYTTCFKIQKVCNLSTQCVCVWCDYHNEQQLQPYKRWTVFSVRYELNSDMFSLLRRPAMHGIRLSPRNSWELHSSGLFRTEYSLRHNSDERRSHVGILRHCSLITWLVPTSTRRPGFDPMSVHVYLVEEMGLGQVFLPVLLLSPVSTIPPLLHTHPFTYHPRYIMFLSQYFSFPLSVPFHQRSIPIHSPTTHVI